MSKNKLVRRDFLIAGLGLTIGGCVSGPMGPLRKLASPGKDFSLKKSLADPYEKMSSHYEAVVIGSGYGASVIAARLAGKFKNLAILERGKEWFPGDFPTDGPQLSAALRTPLNPYGLIEVSAPPRSDLDIVCGSGLGGTSLINAAIAIRPELNVFAQNDWPEAIRAAATDGSLSAYYDVAESILKPKVVTAYERFPKSARLQKSAQEVQRNWGRLRLNIQPTDEIAGLNEFGYPQSACVSCGNCCTGCNFGAKNTLSTNYLSLAKKAGAEIYTLTEVVAIKKSGDGYRISLRHYAPQFGVFKNRTIFAKNVFLGAGAKGSTEILFRSQAPGFQFSKKLGSRLSANGDVLGVAYNIIDKTGILALSGTNARELQRRAPGPIIASYIDYRNPSLENDVNSQFLLLDGVMPSGLHAAVAKGLASYAGLSGQSFTAAQKARIQADLTSIEAPEDGALNHSMLYFACGHDSSGGRMEYNKFLKTFEYKWPGVSKEKTFARINRIMREHTEAQGGTFIENPRSTVFGGRVQATHPLGGCPMGDTVDNGVVDHLGRVFNPGTGNFHTGLYVVDASIIPRSLAATPLLTITALAERIADKISI